MKDQRGWCVVAMIVMIFLGHDTAAAMFCVCGMILNEMREREVREAK